jgi:hypothetical protein
MRPTSTHREATQPVLPPHFTLYQSLPEGPPDQHLYEPPLSSRIHVLVVQGTLVSGSSMVAIFEAEVLGLVRILNG